MKLLLICAMFLLSLPLFAQECATNVNELRSLVGNSALSLNWIENKSDPLYLTVRNGGSGLSLNLRKAAGNWADITGIICRKGDGYVAKVQRLVWGPQAPGIAKGSNVKELRLRFPYQSLLRVSVSIMNLEFSPQ